MKHPAAPSFVTGSEVLEPSAEPLLLDALSLEVLSCYSDVLTVSWFAAGSLTSGSLCSDGVATAQADTKAAKATSKSLKADADDGPPRLPDVATLLNTMRKRLEALNGPELPRI